MKTLKPLLIIIMIMIMFGFAGLSAQPPTLPPPILPPPTNNISKERALSIVQRHFQGMDVDYFFLDDNSPTTWTIFVDAEPMKGWEHDCYVLTVPKYSTVQLVVPTSKEKMKTPPDGNFRPLLVKNRYGTSVNSKPSVSKASLSNADKTAAERTYAIILSGGKNKQSNYERYWNDCSFIYQTLVNKYGVSRGNIFPIMSDGNNPAEDMMIAYGNFRSQPLDLDGDGTEDISMAATKANISTTIDMLKNRMWQDDHLFIFVIDHGGSTDGVNNSYINLWGNEKLSDEELTDLLEPFTRKHVNVNVVLGQCNSGGFVDNLSKLNCVVATASKGD